MPLLILLFWHLSKSQFTFSSVDRINTTNFFSAVRRLGRHLDFFDLGFSLDPDPSSAAQRLVRAVDYSAWPIDHYLMRIVIRLVGLAGQDRIAFAGLGVTLYLVLVDVNYRLHRCPPLQPR